jgi:hypothetical protein
MQVELLVAIRDSSAPRKRTDTSRASEGELNWYCVGQQASRGSADFSDETSFRLVREIVTVASGINL